VTCILLIGNEDVPSVIDYGHHLLSNLGVGVDGRRAHPSQEDLLSRPFPSDGARFEGEAALPWGNLDRIAGRVKLRRRHRQGHDLLVHGNDGAVLVKGLGRAKDEVDSALNCA